MRIRSTDRDDGRRRDESEGRVGGREAMKDAKHRADRWRSEKKEINEKEKKQKRQDGKGQNVIV